MHFVIPAALPYPYDVQSHEVDVLVVGFGMNDCNYWMTDKGVPRVSQNAFRANLHHNSPPLKESFSGNAPSYHETASAITLS